MPKKGKGREGGSGGAGGRSRKGRRARDSGPWSAAVTGAGFGEDLGGPLLREKERSRIGRHRERLRPVGAPRVGPPRRFPAERRPLPARGSPDTSAPPPASPLRGEWPDAPGGSRGPDSAPASPRGRRARPRGGTTSPQALQLLRLLLLRDRVVPRPHAAQDPARGPAEAAPLGATAPRTAQGDGPRRGAPRAAPVDDAAEPVPRVGSATRRPPFALRTVARVVGPVGPTVGGEGARVGRVLTLWSMRPGRIDRAPQPLSPKSHPQDPRRRGGVAHNRAH